MMICQFVNSHQRFGGAFYLCLQGLRSFELGLKVGGKNSLDEGKSLSVYLTSYSTLLEPPSTLL